MLTSTGLYIHIPFCRRKCPYCDFCSVIYEYNLAAEYIDILSEEIGKINTKISTIYIGGGTPTVLDQDLLDKLCRSLRVFFNQSAENTVEANPESLSRGKIESFREYNINRISIGIQSLYDGKLKKLGRIHTAGDGIKAVSLAKQYGFDNISIDLIYGLPGETLSQWREELSRAVKLPLKHLSIYCLTPEAGTPFYKLKRDICDKETADMYSFALDFLPQKGFEQYEVSNFARKGYACLHNTRYWQQESYLGLGVSAVSSIGQVRRRNISDIRKYIDRCGRNRTRTIFREKLYPIRRAKELAALQIRLKQGIDFREFKNKTGFDFFELINESVIDEFKKKRLLKISRKRGKICKIALTKKGYLFSDEVSSSFV
ncbi:MAG: radical SAM family heme chaperone HemW [Candidatus Omnitrophota bacterium]